MKGLNRFNSYLLNRPVSERGDSNRVDILPTITKQNNINNHSSIKVTQTQASLIKNNGFFHQSL